MILPIQWRGRVDRRVFSPVVVSGCAGGARFVKFRYEGPGGRLGVGGREVERLFREVMPAGSRWHLAGLGTGCCGVGGKDGCGCCVSAEWVDVLVDFGRVRSRTVVDVDGGCLDVCGWRPSVEGVSRGWRDGRGGKWCEGWGAPFGVAYDCELCMLNAPVERWRRGERLLTDVGDGVEGVVERGVLRVVSVVVQFQRAE
ncbi:hypothetical protein K458DRAFT_109612 [Lentithecium fluviatile CBS 122367]|uniref:Uncharacterized protein n=1 Tax=Lentithecium fluviatile CBS 122367 TaxID=1168545 RepID=A0A6G1IQ08_9PLEO|nr:hypothetical protein K458DRAFT_109612 [Lentithecium fluviatile CBS 122367]